MAEFASELPDALISPLRATGASDDTSDLPTLETVPIVILAGGRGTRLAPYTSVLPKPLMPVGDRAILEIVVEQLADFGAKNINFCVGYLAHLIRAVFDHRPRPDVEITYVHEEEPLGTAAPLRLVEGLDRTFLTMNGDVLTTLDYRDLLRHHQSQQNILTIATHNRSIKTDYGMLHLDVAARVQGFEEKPEIISPVSMGIYVMEPAVLDYIPASKPFDFPELVLSLLAEDERVGAYLYGGVWFDIGRADDYQTAVDTWMNGHHSEALGHPRTNGRGPHSPNGSAA